MNTDSLAHLQDLIPTWAILWYRFNATLHSQVYVSGDARECEWLCWHV